MITVTPDPSYNPPRVRIEVDTEDPDLYFTTLVIRRDGVPLREQAVAGFSSAVVWDYEAPYGVPVIYSYTGVKAGDMPVHVEDWADLTGWNTIAGTPSVADGALTSTGVEATVEQDLPSPLLAGKIVFDAPFTDTGAPMNCYFDMGDTDRLQIRSGAVQWRPASGTSLAQFAPQGSGQVTYVWNATKFSMTTSEGLAVRGNKSPVALQRMRARVFTDVGDAIPGFTVYELDNPQSVTESTTTLLEVGDPWLIHPVNPSLSFQLGTLLDEAGVVSFGGTVNASTSTEHRVLGADLPVVVTSGPRIADNRTVLLESLTKQEKVALDALLKDQTPILFRFPAAWDVDFAEGYYRVGDVSRVPLIGRAGDWLMGWSLPCQMVQRPPTRPVPVWTWGSLMAAFATWEDVLNAYETWYDVLVDARV